MNVTPRLSRDAAKHLSQNSMVLTGNSQRWPERTRLTQKQPETYQNVQNRFSLGLKLWSLKYRHSNPPKKKIWGRMVVIPKNFLSLHSLHPCAIRLQVLQNSPSFYFPFFFRILSQACNSYPGCPLCWLALWSYFPCGNPYYLWRLPAPIPNSSLFL